MKLLRERSAANLHAAFEVAGIGNGRMVKATRARNRKRRIQTSLHLELHRASLRPYRTFQKNEKTI